MKDFTIGIAGLASYATVDIFKRIVDAFPAEKEWERPRVIVDNDCRIPSRVRAILYGENIEEIVSGMTSQIHYLIDGGADKIIVGCNTAHYFLPSVCEHLNPKESDRILNIITNLGTYILEKYGEIEIGLVASEGVLDTKIYHKNYEKKGISVYSPDKDKYILIREMIESVKQCKINAEIIRKFLNLIEEFPQQHIVLGCTELPVLYDVATNEGYSFDKIILDPVTIAIDALKTEWMSLSDVKNFS